MHLRPFRAQTLRQMKRADDEPVRRFEVANLATRRLTTRSLCWALDCMLRGRVAKVDVAGVPGKMSIGRTVRFAGFLATVALLSSCSAGPNAAPPEVVESSKQALAHANAPGWIAPFCGTGTRGVSTDGAVATAANLNAPGGLAVSPAGEVYISDTGNNRVVKVDASGKLTTVVGQAGTATRVALFWMSMTRETFLARPAGQRFTTSVSRQLVRLGSG